MKDIEKEDKLLDGKTKEKYHIILSGEYNY